jgi:hypothetical protein
MQMIPLGDMLVVGDLPPEQWPPAKMWKALAAIADRLHPAYDEFKIGSSRDKCLFASLTARDFLVHIGFGDATVRGVGFLADAVGRDGKPLHALGIGVPGDRSEVPEKFNGHAVVTVPSIGLMIDPTLYQADRPAWGGALPGMIALPLLAEPVWNAYSQRYLIAGLDLRSADRTVSFGWIDRPELKWRKSDDFRVKNARRIAVTRALVEHFGRWEDAA